MSVRIRPYTPLTGYRHPSLSVSDSWTDRHPEVADVIVSSFAARRKLLTEWGEGGLVIVGSSDEPSALRLREFATRSRIPHPFIDRSDTEAVTRLTEICDIPEQGTAVVTGRSEVLVAPEPRESARALGLDLAADRGQRFEVLVVGAGPRAGSRRRRVRSF